MSKNLPATTRDLQVTTYKSRSGEQITLSLDVVRTFLVTGKRELVTDQEIVLFMGICRAIGANPFKKDAYLVKFDQNPAAVITSINFYRSRAKAQPDCTGWQAGVICLNKKDGTLRYSNGLVLPTEELVGGWFEAQPVGWDAPLRLEVNLSGYAKGNAFWTPQKAPSMISKVAESQGLRTCWPDEFGGTISAEEIGELSEALTTGDNMLPPSSGDITPKSEPEFKPIDFSKLKNFPAFDALVGPKIQDLHPDDQTLRVSHLKIFLQSLAQTRPGYKKNQVAECEALLVSGMKYFEPFIDPKKEQQPGFWGAFLAWEAKPDRPWNQEQTEPVTEPGAEAEAGFIPRFEGDFPGNPKGREQTQKEDDGPVTEGEGQGEEPFEARKNRVWGLVVQKYGKTKDMKENLGIARSADITEDNVDEIEEKVTA